VAKSKYHKEFNGFNIFVGLLNTLNYSKLNLSLDFLILILISAL